MTRPPAQPAQLGFDALLATAEDDNHSRKVERACVHLPGTYREALPFYRALLEQHHAAMLAGDAATAMQLRSETRALARKLNHFDPGIIADETAPGCMLDRVTRAPKGTVPLWGQSGSFEIDVDGMRARIAMEGIFGLASNVYHWLGFAAHAPQRDRPFLSETGYRSFIAVGGELQPGFTPDRMAHDVIAEHVRRALKGKLLAVTPEHGGPVRRAA